MITYLWLLNLYIAWTTWVREKLGTWLLIWIWVRHMTGWSEVTLKMLWEKWVLMRDGLDNHDVCKNSLLLLINGKPRGFIRPSRGIRQGDPTLSPFLFLLCSEGLHGLIQHAANLGEIKGFPLCKRGPANDSLLFYRAVMNAERSLISLRNMKVSQAKRWTKTKQLFSLASLPLKQPNNKSRLPWAYKKWCILSNTLGCHHFVGRRKERKASILSKRRCGEGCKDGNGIQAVWEGYGVLIKAVIQAILTYAMGCFKIPFGLCHEIETTIRKFWWGQRRKKKDPLGEMGGAHKIKNGGRYGV